MALHIENQSLSCPYQVNDSVQQNQSKYTSPCPSSLASESTERQKGLRCVWYQTALPENALRLVSASGLSSGDENKQTKTLKLIFHMLQISVVELRRLRRDVWSQSSTIWMTCQLSNWRLTIPIFHLLPLRFCMEPVMTVACIEVQWSLSGNNSCFFSKMLSEQVNAVWLRHMEDSSYKRRDRSFICNWAVLQNKHTLWCSSSRLSVATRDPRDPLDPALLLEGNNVLSTLSLVIWCFHSLSPEGTSPVSPTNDAQHF